MELNYTSILQLPDLLAPQASLPSDVAFQATISIYVIVASAGVLSWDVLNNLGGDYSLLFNHTIRAPTVVYFISRCGSLGFVLTSTILSAPAGSCAIVEGIATWMYPVAVSSTALLFFFRVRAVFDKNAVVVAFFGCMWLAVLAGVVTSIRGVIGGRVGPSNSCVIAGVQQYVMAAAIIPLVNDTFVFLAISCRLMRCAVVDHSMKTGVRTLAFGDYMLPLSKALLQDGQKYYLATVTTSLVAVIMLYLKAVPPDYRTMSTVPNVTVMNVMACRVFRNTKLGLFKATEITSRGLVSMGPVNTRRCWRRTQRPSFSIASMRFATRNSLESVVNSEQPRQTSKVADHDHDQGEKWGEMESQFECSGNAVV